MPAKSCSTSIGPKSAIDTARDDEDPVSPGLTGFLHASSTSPRLLGLVLFDCLRGSAVARCPCGDEADDRPLRLPGPPRAGDEGPPSPRSPRTTLRLGRGRAPALPSARRAGRAPPGRGDRQDGRESGQAALEASIEDRQRLRLVLRSQSAHCPGQWGGGDYDGHDVQADLPQTRQPPRRRALPAAEELVAQSRLQAHRTSW